MVSYESYIYKDTGNTLTYLPENTHLIIETTLYLYYVRDDDPTELWKYTISSGVSAQVDVDPGDASGDTKSRSGDIISIWHNRDDDFLYGIDQTVGLTTKSFKLDLSDDTVTELGTITSTTTGDFIDINSNMETLVAVWDVDPPGDDSVLLQAWNEDFSGLQASQNMGLLGVRTFKMSFATVVGTTAYILWKWSDENVELWKYDAVGNTFTEMEDCGAATDLPDSRNQNGISYDGSNILYFILEDTGDSKEYLYSYQITEDSLVKGGEYNVALMLNRNSIQTAGSPWDIEKGFHITNDDVYRIVEGFTYLLKIQSLGLAGGKTIKAVTDKYAIDEDKKVYLYTESIAEMHTARGSYQTHRTPKGRFSHADEFSTDQLIEIYENNAGTYTLVFRGKMGTPTYDQRRGLWNYAINNMGADDLKEDVSYEASAEGIDEVVLALIGKLTNPYIYADVTSVPNIATNMSYDFSKMPLRDCLYVCCILGNAYWWVEPNGYLYFRAYGNPPASGDTYSNAAGNMGNPKVNKHQAQFNDFSNVNGGMNHSTAEYYVATTPTIAEHVQQYGKKLWKGRTLFIGAESKASIDAIVAGLKAWQGMVSNPIDASFKVNQYYYPIGYDASVQFTLNNLIPTAIDMIIIGNLTNFKKPNLIDLAVSTNIVRRR